MAQLYLASSALPGYDLIATVESAAQYGFDGCQLYINEKAGEPVYFNDLTKKIQKAALPVIIHLPDIFSPLNLKQAALLKSLHPQNKILWHFLPQRFNSVLPAEITILENAVFGCDSEYYERLFETVNRLKLQTALDLPRIFDGRNSLDAGIEFARQQLNRLNKNDLLHLIDFKETSTIRQEWCALGNGMMGTFVSFFRSFAGVIVLEYEELDMAVASRNILS